VAVIRPFRALRPSPERAEAVASVPYDVVNTEEARTLASGKPLSFLHVSRPEIDLPPGTGDVVISLVQTVPLTGAVVISTGSSVALQDARKALEMFHQVKVDVLGMVENMSQMTLPSGEVIDVFGAGGTERTAAQFAIAFLGAVDMDPQIREGGDKGLPVALAGPDSKLCKGFYEVAAKVAERAKEVAAKSEDVIEIS